MNLAAPEWLIYFWYMVAVGGVQRFAELRYTVLSTGNKLKKSWYFIYLFSSLLLSFLCAAVNMPDYAVLLLNSCLLFLFSLKLLKLPALMGGACCVVTFTLNTFYEAFLELILRPALTGFSVPHQWARIAIQISASLVLLFLQIVGYHFLVKKYPFQNNDILPSHLMVLLLPCALIVWAIRFVIGQDLVAPNRIFSLFFRIIVSMATFFAMTAMFSRITYVVTTERENALLKEQFRCQRQHTDEALLRYNGYRSYQHDIKNHLLVLSGLLNNRAYDEAKQYLKKLDRSALLTTPKISTGSPPLDVLLGEKIVFAEKNNIKVEHFVKVPQIEKFDEIDLCVVFSNALDNAISACVNEPADYRSITINAKKHHEFLIIKIDNGVSKATLPIKYGVGLNNIKYIAHRYGGTIKTEIQDNCFELIVFLSYIK